MTIGANLSGDVSLGQVTTAVEQAVEKAGVPPGIRVFYGGDAENMRDMFSDMMLALSLAVLFVYIIMVSLFESYIHPFTIMFSLPVALVGAFIGLACVGFVPEHVQHDRHHHAHGTGDKERDSACGLHQHAPVARRGDA